MGPFEFFALAIMMVMIILVVIAKIFTSQRINLMKVQIAQVVHIRQEAYNRLKSAQSQKGVADQGQRMLIDKRNKLVKRIAKLKEEINNMEKEESARKQRTSMRKVDLE
jgi:50S ribosomal subunit-associated GTPase HflX